ncbi:TetR/AcrR family transcriptional regulator [Hyphococcus sp.]|uniref:TetR/AcrR family transcriptional regulator n=1 Tax=Hyphococcus sp. TaxID=2038636 RepID=UPI0035C732ED
MTVDDVTDRRVKRTRMAIFEAFRELVLTRKYDDIRLADIIDMSGIGRSTFYEHFRNKDDVLVTSIEPLFSALAKIPPGAAEREHVQFVIEHFWEQRRFARIVFRDVLYEKLSRKLADMIELEIAVGDPAEKRFQSVAAASAMLGVIRAWLAGEFSMTAEDLSRRLMQTARQEVGGDD